MTTDSTLRTPTRQPVSLDRLEKWMSVYQAELTKAVAAHPTEYYYPVEEVPAVAAKMRAAFRDGSYNYEGRAIRSTCKILGIRHTYRAINAFLRDEG